MKTGNPEQKVTKETEAKSLNCSVFSVSPVKKLKTIESLIPHGRQLYCRAGARRSRTRHPGCSIAINSRLLRSSGSYPKVEHSDPGGV